MDTNRVNMDTMPLRRGHFRVLIAASLGQLTGAGLATLVGVVLPMIRLVRADGLSSFAQGAVAATSLVGILVGSLMIGAWSDRKGYLVFFRGCPVLILAAALMAYFARDLAGLVVGLFLMGVGIGGGYSLDSDYISEIMPRRWRLFMVGVAKASSALGNILVAAACFWLLRSWHDPALWNRLLLLIAALAAVMLLCSLRFEESPGWLAAHGRIDEARRSVRYFLGPDVELGELADKSRHAGTATVTWRDLVRRDNAKKALFCGVPWACEGVAVYGIGVFLPVLIMALGIESATEGPYARIVGSVETSIWINLFVAVGFVVGLLLVDRWYHVRTQSRGFALAAAGLALLLAAYELHWPKGWALAGFILFEFFLNAGPHLMTFILPPQIYPVAQRGAGAGLAAAAGKAGAVIGVLFMPLLLEWGGARLVLGVTIAVLILGAVVTERLGTEILPYRGRGHRPELRHDR